MAKKHSTARDIVLPLIAAFCLVFTLLGTFLGITGMVMIHSSSPYTSQFKKQNTATIIHDSLSATFEAQVNTTAIPASVYLDVLTEDYLTEQMDAMVDDAIDTLSGDGSLDWSFPELDEAITSYFEQFATENDYTIDDAYTEKLAESIDNAEKTVQDALDVYHFSTMNRAGILNKINRYATPLLVVTCLCALLSIALILYLVIAKRTSYWLGISLFTDGVLCTIPAIIILASGIIWQFAYKDAAVYTTCTGLFFTLTYLLLIVGIILLVLGIVAVLIPLIHTPKNIATEQKTPEIQDTKENTPDTISDKQKEDIKAT